MTKSTPITMKERYATLVEQLLGKEDVTFGRPGQKGFGKSALWTNNKVFAMLVKNTFIV